MGQDQGQGQDHLLLQRAALPPFLVLALTLTLVLALVRNIIIFSKVRVLVLNQPIVLLLLLENIGKIKGRGDLSLADLGPEPEP